MRNLDTSPHPVADATARRPVPARRRRQPASVLAVVAGAVAFALVVVLAVALAVSRAASGDGPGGAGGLLGTASVGAALGGDPGPGDGATGEAGGDVPPGTSPFDEDVPAVRGLDPRLLDALQRATTDATADDVVVVVNGGWRSPAYQERLLDEAVVQYGSRTEAARWVATPETSAHVLGDVGSWDATAWFSEHGAAYGLCQIYENESWHYELRPEAAAQGCPPMFRDPTEDPRMHP